MENNLDASMNVMAQTLHLNDKEAAFAHELVEALGKVDRALLPAAAWHPFSGLVAAGAGGVERLLTLAEGNNLQKKLDALDALAHVLLYQGGTPRAFARLRDMLVREQDPAIAACIVKCLAIGGEVRLMAEQLVRLADEDPAMVATAARLLGLGRYAPAVAVLRNLVSPARMYESRSVIWALGEMGDASALKELHHALTQGFRTVDVLIAVGKIGQLASVPYVTPMLLDGLAEQRDAAYRALAMILDHNRDVLEPMDEIRHGLARLVLAQLDGNDLTLSGSTRFHMLLCLARLGEDLDVARVRRYLGLNLKDDEAGGVASFFKSRQGKKPAPTAGKRKAAAAEEDPSADAMQAFFTRRGAKK